MLIQLHWQNRENLSQTELVAQTEFTGTHDFQVWCEDLLQRRGNEMPAGWCPLVCTEDSEYFVTAPHIVPSVSHG